MNEFEHARLLLTKLAQNGHVAIRFINPAGAVCLAVMASAGRQGMTSFVGRAMGYARASGLESVLLQCAPESQLNEFSGVTYSPLTRLRLPLDVDRCNGTINALFRSRLAAHGSTFVRDLCKVVGELHDNVTSHSRGVGYSAAQVYGHRLIFSIADGGRGLLRAVSRAAPGVSTDAAAICWAFEKGNTGAGAAAIDPFAQRWAPGAYDAEADIGEEQNHHQGLGLWELEQLVTRCGGRLWVWSGSAARSLSADGWVDIDPGLEWRGVAITLELPLHLDGERAVDTYDQASDAELAKELGL